ncbi:DNA (cytosine-5-)-methyltransferase [Candidatus Pacearchaeota archaeon]|nr:DNA (cytosine-5-)-methyltransferase [Candidatus Pacearchaeota archaeon]
MYTFAELTAGVGTGRLALESLGCQYIWSAEIDPECKKEIAEELKCAGEHHLTDDTTSKCDICDSKKSQYARITYKANFKEYQTYGNIRDLKDPPYADIIVSGFPCPSFSLAGMRKGFEDTRGETFFEVSRIIGEVRPKAFILENVEGILSHDKRRTIKRVLKELKSQGYIVHHKLLNSTDYEIPQNRPRVYFVGFREDIYNPLLHGTFTYPTKRKLLLTVGDLLEPEVDEKYYLSEKMVKHLIERMKGDYSKPHISDGKGISRTLSSGGNASGVTSNTTVILDAYNDTIKDNGITGALKAKGISGKTGHYVTVYQQRNAEGLREYNGICPTLQQNMGTGGNNAPIIVHNLQPRSPDRPSSKHSSGGSGHLARDDGKAYSLSTGNCQAVEKGMRLRKFTPKECFRLQGFQDSFVNKTIRAGMSDTQLYRQAGNAFTLSVVKAVAKHVLKTLEALE